MNLSAFGKLLRRNLKEHSPIILSAAAGIGTIATAYLAAKASFKAARLIDTYDELNGISEDRKERLMERTKLVWKLYIPTATSAATTIVCIVGANRVEAKKTIAAQAMFAVSQRVYSEYRDKVIEEYGSHKDQSIRDKIADERIKALPPPSGGQDILIAGPGNVLCCEMFTMRYFNSDMEALRKAVNEVNKKALSQDYATLDDYYYLVGLARTSYSSHVGWKSNRLMELTFTTILTDDGRPCLAFDYNYTEPV
jgi:hypothetical protein